MVPRSMGWLTILGVQTGHHQRACTYKIGLIVAKISTATRSIMLQHRPPNVSALRQRTLAVSALHAKEQRVAGARMAHLG